MCCLKLKAEGIDNLKKLLENIGYSEEAIKEILKWYAPYKKSG